MAKTQVNLIDEKYLQAFLEHIKKINFTTDYKRGYLVGSGEGKSTPLSTNALTIITAINELYGALPKKADGTYDVQASALSNDLKAKFGANVKTIEDALGELASKTNFKFAEGGYIKNTDGSVDIDSEKIAKGANKSTQEGDGKDYSTKTNLATQGYVDEKVGEINNTTVGVVGNKGSETVVSFTKDTTDTTKPNNYYITLTSNNGDKTAIGFDATAFIKDGYLDNVDLIEEVGEDKLVFTFNTDSGKTTPIKVSLKKFVDTYTKGNGINITNNEITAVADGYVKVDENGIQLDSAKITMANTADTGKNAANLSSQGYVDTQITANAYVVSTLTFAEGKFDLNKDNTATTNG